MDITLIIIQVGDYFIIKSEFGDIICTGVKDPAVNN